jgi:hypothetical protein
MLYIIAWIYIYAALREYFILILELNLFIKLVGIIKSDGVLLNKREIVNY